jgi:hypothetical protein
MKARAEATRNHEAMIRLVRTIASNSTPGPAKQGESHTELAKLWCLRAFREHFKRNPPVRVLKSDPTRGNLLAVLDKHPDIRAAQGGLPTTGALLAKANPSTGTTVSTRNSHLFVNRNAFDHLALPVLPAIVGAVHQQQLQGLAQAFQGEGEFCFEERLQARRRNMRQGGRQDDVFHEPRGRCET